MSAVVLCGLVLKFKPHIHTSLFLKFKHTGESCVNTTKSKTTNVHFCVFAGWSASPNV